MQTKRSMTIRDPTGVLVKRLLLSSTCPSYGKKVPQQWVGLPIFGQYNLSCG